MLTLQFTPNGRWHEDLVLEMNERTWLCDSYYFVIDHRVQGEENIEKVQRGLVKLLEQWINTLKSAAPVDLVYLPYDFSDQYVGCLRCELNSESVVVTRGWSLIPGHSVTPSDITGFVRQVRDFRDDGPGATMLRDTICASIDESIERIKVGPSH